MGRVYRVLRGVTCSGAHNPHAANSFAPAPRKTLSLRLLRAGLFHTFCLASRLSGEWRKAKAPHTRGRHSARAQTGRRLNFRKPVAWEREVPPGTEAGVPMALTLGGSGGHRGALADG